MTIQAGSYAVGEVPPPITYTFTDSNGVALNLTGYTRARFRYKVRGGVAVDRAAVVTSALGGQVTYTWVQADLNTAGGYTAEFSVDNLANLYTSELITYYVRPAVGTPAVI